MGGKEGKNHALEKKELKESTKKKMKWVDCWKEKKVSKERMKERIEKAVAKQKDQSQAKKGK